LALPAVLEVYTIHDDRLIDPYTTLHERNTRSFFHMPFASFAADPEPAHC